MTCHVGFVLEGINGRGFQEQLDDSEKAKLGQLLKKYESLFDGTLGDWKGSPISLELKEGATPYHGWAYPIPQIHERAMRIKVDHLISLGVLEECNDSELGAPTFIIPKKDGRIRFISDFRKLNTFVKRKPYPLPKIQDMLLKLQDFRYALALNLNMGYTTRSSLIRTRKNYVRLYYTVG